MSYVKPIISVILLSSLIYILSIPIQSGDSTVPPLGNFLNPFSGFWQNGDAELQGQESISLKGIGAEVEVRYDERNVPHIFAANFEDLIFAQGYVIAKERLWQMDITTRAVEGKTSEVLGKVSLGQDKRARERGLYRAAELADLTWSENTEGYALLQQFCAGINHYVESLSPDDYPLEFKLLNYAPQKWTPYRTALFIKAMAITLNYAHKDIPATNALRVLGKDLFNDLYPDKNSKQSPIIQDVDWLEPTVSLEEQIHDDFKDILFLGNERSAHEQFIGSNSFAVNGQKTKSGSAILANDPHLKLTLPSIWIEMHLVCPGFNTYGVSLPGLPGITLGFNESISWGQTNVGQDVLDIYRVKWVGDDRDHYLLDGKKLATEIVIEEIKVKGADDVLDTVLYTSWGPIIKENDKQTDLAQRWVSADAPSPKEIDVYLDINKSQNVDDFKNALMNFSTPAQNFIFASTEGDIGMFVTGKFPVKSDQQGRFIQDGSKSSAAWKGFIPFNELPQELNPTRNYVASANQHSTDDTYPYYYNGGFEDFRGRYINRMVGDMESVSTQELMNLQLDAYSLKVEESLPLLLENLDEANLSNKENEVIESLKEWNYVYTSKSMAATYFEKWWSEFYRMALDEIVEIRDTLDVPMVEEFRLIEMMESDHWIFDIKNTSEEENLQQIVNASFKTVNFDSLKAEPWSIERHTTIDHLTNIPSFGYQDIKSPGHGNTPNAISRHNGPSWRMVVEMSDPVTGYGVYPGGISGNPGSPFYNNFVGDWDSGKYYKLHSSSEKDKLDARFTLKITPEE